MRSAALALYRGGTALLTPFARILLARRARRGREDASRLAERFGHASLARPAAPLVWLHGASMGETLATLPLIDHLTQRGFAVLVSTGTRTSADLLLKRLPADAFHQYAPLDLPRAVDRFLAHWRPNLLLLAESEIWPNILHGCATNGVPVALINARMSARSFARWRIVPRLSREIYDGFAMCIAQSTEHAQRFIALGAHAVAIANNLKYDVAPPPADPAELVHWRNIIGARGVVVATSTHAGDETIVLDAHRALRPSMPDLLTIIVPRHPDRGAEILALARQRSLAAITRSGDLAISANTDVLVADTIGEMGLWLRLATIAISGKTFGDGGGQTPIEAALCGVPILHGPSTHHFAEVFAALDDARGAQSATAASLPTQLATLLDDPAACAGMGEAATTTIATLAGGTQATLAKLEPLLSAALRYAAKS